MHYFDSACRHFLFILKNFIMHTILVCPPHKLTRKKFCFPQVRFYAFYEKNRIKYIYLYLHHFRILMMWRQHFYFFIYISTCFWILGRNVLVYFLQQTNNWWNTWPVKVITFCAVYECATLSISFLLTSTV